jgi:hypothetical protein
VPVTGTTSLDRLYKKTRRAAERNLAADEHVVAVLRGRSKQAMVVTDRQILIVTAGMNAGFRATAASFSFEDIAAINLHTGRGVAALEVVKAGSKPAIKSNLRAAYKRPNWLPCHRYMGDSPLVGELRSFVRSGGRSQSARAALSPTGEK